MRIVIAVGGNALIREDERGTWTEQTAHALEAARAIARVARAHEVVLTHGNGPQVGALVLQQSSGEPDAPALPLDVLDAMTQGEIGYLLQQALARRRPVAADRDAPDPRAASTPTTRRSTAPPTKPIGPFYDEAEARRLARRARLGRGARRRPRLAADGAEPAPARDRRAARDRGARRGAACS